MSINQDDEYYLTLPSNVSGPNNSISSWTTTLPSTLQLHGQWEFGLAEIIYTNSAYTIPDPLPFEIHYQTGKIEHYYVPEGNYDSPGKLVAVLSSVVGSRPRARKRRDVASTTTVQQAKDDVNLDEGFEADDDDLVKPIDKDGGKPDEGLEVDDNDLIKPIGSTPAQPPKDNKEGEVGTQTPKPKPDDSAVSSGKPAQTSAPAGAQKENEASSTVAPPAAKPKPEKVTPSEVKPSQNIPKDPPSAPAQPKPAKNDTNGKPQEKPVETVTGTPNVPKPETAGQPAKPVDGPKPDTLTTIPEEDETLEEDTETDLVKVVTVEYPPVQVPVTVHVKEGEFQRSTLQLQSDTQVVYPSWGRNEPIAPKRKAPKRIEMVLPKLPKLREPITAEPAFGIIQMLPENPAQEVGKVVGEEDDEMTEGVEGTTAAEEQDADEDTDLVQPSGSGGAPISFEHHEFSNRIKILIEQARVASVRLSKGLMFLLGFEDSILTESRLSKYSPTTQAGSNALYIFSDITAYSILGDTTTNQLRIVPVTGSYGSTCNSVFNPIRYFGCRTGLINSIQIDIRNEYGELVKFHYGTAVVVLHLRKKHH